MKGSRGPYAKSVARRDAILDAAFHVFATAGYSDGSLEDIATAVGVTKPALRYYFASKAELFVAVLEHWDLMARYVSPQNQLDPVEHLYGFVLLAEHNRTMPGIIDLHTRTAAEAVTDDHPARDYYIRRYEFLIFRITEALTRCRKRGLLQPGVDPAQAARYITAMWDGLQIQWRIQGDEVDVVADFEHYIGTLLTPDAHWDQWIRTRHESAD